MDVQGALADGYSIGEVADELGRRVGMDTAAARADGYSDQDILGEAQRRAASQGSNDDLINQLDAAGQAGGYPSVAASTQAANALGAAAKAILPDSIQRGTAQALQGAADTANVLGAPTAGRALAGLVNKDELAKETSGSRVVKNFNAGNYGSAIANLPGFAGEMLPQVLPYLAAGAVGGPLAAAAVGGMTNVATQAGDIAKARAAANGRAVPNDADIATAIAAPAVLGALGSVGGVGNVGGALVSALKGSVAGRLSAGVANASVHALTGAAQAAGTDAAQTLGTSQGLTIDPGQMAAGAALGGLQRGGMDVMGAGARGAVRLATGSLGDPADLLTAYSALSPEQRQRVTAATAANAAVQDVLASSAAGSTPTYTQAANTAKTNLVAGIKSLAATLQDSGRIDDDGATAIKAAAAAAANPRTALTDGDDSTPGHLQAIRDLGLDGNTTDSLVNALQVTNVLSDPASLAQKSGPLATLGGIVGGGAGAKAALFSMGLSPFARLLLGGSAADVGRTVGAAFDRQLGLGKVSLNREATRAGAMLAAAGEPVPSTMADLQAAIDTRRSAVQDLSDQLGVKPLTDPAVLAAANRAAAQGGLTGGSSTPPPTAPSDPLNAAILRGVDADVLGGGQGGASGVPPDVVAAAQARAAAAQPQGTATGAGGAPSPAVPPPISPSDLLAGVGRRLAPWKWAIGDGVAQALHLAGTPQNINYAAEANAAVDQAVRMGLLEGVPGISAERLGAALKLHDGRLTGPVFNALRNIALTRNGVDRTDPTWTDASMAGLAAGAPVVGGVSVGAAGP